MTHGESWVVASGSPFDGLYLHGVFHSPEEATEWASNNVDGEWWIVPLFVVPPEDDEKEG